MKTNRIPLVNKKFTSIHHQILEDFKDEPKAGFILIQILSDSDNHLEKYGTVEYIQKKWGITPKSWRLIRSILMEKGYYNEYSKKQDKKTGQWVHNIVVSDHPIEGWKIKRKKKEEPAVDTTPLEDKKEVGLIAFNNKAGILSDIKN